MCPLRGIHALSSEIPSRRLPGTPKTAKLRLDVHGAPSIHMGPCLASSSFPPSPPPHSSLFCPKCLVYPDSTLISENLLSCTGVALLPWFSASGKTSSCKPWPGIQSCILAARPWPVGAVSRPLTPPRKRWIPTPTC